MHFTRDAFYNIITAESDGRTYIRSSDTPMLALAFEVFWLDESTGKRVGFWKRRKLERAFQNWHVRSQYAKHLEGVKHSAIRQLAGTGTSSTTSSSTNQLDIWDTDNITFTST